MITYAKIRAKTGNKITFEKGQDYYKTGKVEAIEVERQQPEHEISARVRGSGNEYYRVNMVYDTEFEEIADYDCDCPAFFSYRGMCKHCVAVAMEYMEQEQSRRMQAGKSELRGQIALTSGSGMRMQPITELQTNALVRQMLEQRSVQRTLPMVESELFGSVRLEPIFWCDQGRVEVEFKIGAGTMYVLKDVFAFVDTLKNKREYRYGQKLKFVHCMEMFAPESAALVSFVCRWVETNLRQFAKGYYNNYVLPKLRRITLTGAEFEELLEMVSGEVPVGNSGWEPRPCPIVRESYRRPMLIQGREQGIEVFLKAAVCYEGRRSWIYYEDNKLILVPREEMEPARDFLACFEQGHLSSVYIQRSDVPLFCREVLPALDECFACEKKNFSPQMYGVEDAVFEIYLDKVPENMITGQVFAVYGEQKFNIYQDKSTDGGRDVTREWAVRQALAKYFNAYDESAGMMVLADDEEKEYVLLTEGIPFFQTLGEVYVSDILKRMKVKPAPRVQVGVSLSGNMLELKLLSDDMDMDRLAEILSKYDRKKKYYRLKNGEFVTVSGEDMDALHSLKEALGLSDQDLRSGQVQLPKYWALFMDEQLRRFESGSAVRNRDFKALIRNMKTVEDSDFEVPESLRGVLREYQKRGFLWLKTLKWNGFGGILADDMGLGKTLQVIAFLLSEQAEAPSLVVCPASLVYNWESELQRFAPELNVRVVVGSAAERKKLIEEISKGEIVVTSYDLLKRDVELYQNVRFATEIIDEAQYIKNHLTQAAIAVKQIEADCKLALTGTPIENRLSELWSIFDYLMPGFLYTYRDFHRNIELPVVQRQDKETSERLKKMVQPFILRRLKKDVLKDLPDKCVEKVYARLTGEQRELYDAHVKRLQVLLANCSEPGDRMRVLAELTKLRQVCCDPALLYGNYEGESAKLELCLELVRTAIQGGHKLLLFSQFTSMLDRIAARLQGEGIGYHMLTGATSRENRKRMVDSFQTDDTPVFCISLKAGGTGLNLTAADMVIHYDPWWNQAAEDQATDRTHRIGQEKDVTVYKLIAKGTIEERVVELQDRKRDLSDRMLEGDLDGSMLTPEEIMEILSKG